MDAATATVRQSAFAMPWRSPAFPCGPYRFVRREYVIVKTRTERAALSAWCRRRWKSSTTL